MRLGIIGLPQSGKTTVFNALTRGNQPTTVSGGRFEVRTGVVDVPDPRVDRLVETARATLDDAARNELYRKMGRILYDEAPYTFLYSRPSLDVVRDDVRGIRPSVAWYDLQDVWLAEQ